jgi:hypothetical protein
MSTKEKEIRRGTPRAMQRHVTMVAEGGAQFVGDVMRVIVPVKEQLENSLS